MREVERYTSPSRLAAEKRVVFRRLPIIVGRATDLPAPGRFFTHDAADVPLLLTRDGAGQAHAMINLCRHRGTRLVHVEQGTAETFVCRYHSWKYDLGGQLQRPGRVSLPAVVEQFMDESALTSLPCETRHGFLWTLPTARGHLDVASWLGDRDAELTARGLDEHVVYRRSTLSRRANWKLVVEELLFAAGAVPVYPNSLLLLGAATAGGPESVSHVAIFPRELGEATVFHTMLVRALPGTDAERTALDEAWNAVEETILRGPFPENGSAPPIRAFHDVLDRAVAASPQRRE